MHSASRRGCGLQPLSACSPAELPCLPAPSSAFSGKRSLPFSRKSKPASHPPAGFFSPARFIASLGGGSSRDTSAISILAGQPAEARPFRPARFRFPRGARAVCTASPARGARAALAAVRLAAPVPPGRPGRPKDPTTRSLAALGGPLAHGGPGSPTAAPAHPRPAPARPGRPGSRTAASGSPTAAPARPRPPTAAQDR